MKIREVAISGYRSLWNVSIADLGDGVNVFFGDNNCGKSNILEALEMLFKVERTDLPVSGFYGGELTNFIDNFTVKADGTTATSINIRCKLAIGSEDVDKLPVFVDFLKKNRIFSKVHKQWVDFEVEITPAISGVANRVLKIATINNHVMYDSSIPQPGSFFPNLSKKASISAGEKENAAGAFFGYLVNSFNKIHTGRLMETRKTVEGSRGDVSMSIQEFKEWLRGLIESRGDKYRTFQKVQKRFKERPFAYGTIRPVSTGDKADLLVTDMFGREFMVERLGTGVQQILILLSQIAARVSVDKTKIFGIEELELNLSPNVQMEALNMLKEMAADPASSGFSQVFLTSHSPYLCKRDCPDLYAVSIDGKAGTQVKHGPNATRTMIKHYNYEFFK
jgi:hypothetical protein